MSVPSSVSSFLFCCFYPAGNGGHRTGAYHYRSRPTSSNTSYYHEGSLAGAGRRMGRTKPLSLQTVELKVRMCCSGCERVVKHAVTKKLRGVDSVEVDVAMEKVTVTGYVDRQRVLKEVRRAGKKAEFWPNPGPPPHFTTAENYFRDDEESYRRSYNYYRHGYNNNGDRHGHLPEPRRGADPVGNMFNDDDVNACSIM